MQGVVDFFDRYAEQVPLELFVLIGTFVEELFSPIPSFAVLVPAGAAAKARAAGIWYLAVLVVLSAIGRIGGATILYWLADRFEGRLFGHGRRFFGISHTELERFGQRLGCGKRDWAALFFMNAAPVFPGGVLSLTCGFVKVRYRMFLACTFFGTMVNAIIYLSIGYAGLKTAEAVRNIEIASQIVLGLAIAGVVIWIIRKRRAKTAVR